MQRTKIEYLTHTYNPLAMRCTPVSAGCDHCWHLRMANRLGSNPVLSEEDRNGYNLGIPWLRDKELVAPLKLRKPARIGVQFMGDLFHESVTNEQIAAVFGVMAAAHQHTFCVLTKRHERMLEWFGLIPREHRWSTFSRMFRGLVPGGIPMLIGQMFQWPLPNVWLGVSVEDQATADERIPWLLKIPAAKRFVSCEPLLGPVDLNKRECLIDKSRFKLTLGNYLDLVIVGAETGPGKRPAELDWFRSLRDQCAAANVPFFFKRDSNGSRELDGRIHEEMP